MCIVGIGVIGGLVYSNKKQIMAVSPPEKKIKNKPLKYNGIMSVNFDPVTEGKNIVDTVYDGAVLSGLTI